MKTTRSTLFICLLAFICVSSWEYSGYCKEKTRKEYYPNGKSQSEKTYKNNIL